MLKSFSHCSAPFPAFISLYYSGKGGWWEWGVSRWLLLLALAIDSNPCYSTLGSLRGHVKSSVFLICLNFWQTLCTWASEVRSSHISLPSSIPMAAKFCLESVTVLSQKTVSGFPSVVADLCFVLVQNPERVDICWSCVGEIHSSSRGRCVLLLPLPRKPWRRGDLLFSRWRLKAFT